VSRMAEVLIALIVLSSQANEPKFI